MISEQIEATRASGMKKIIDQLRKARVIDKRGQELKRLRANVQSQLLVMERKRSLVARAKSLLDAIQEETVREEFRRAAQQENVEEKARIVQDILDKLDADQKTLEEALELERTETRVDLLEKMVTKWNGLIAQHVTASGDEGSESPPRISENRSNPNILIDINNLQRELQSFEESKDEATQLPATKRDFSFLDQFSEPED